MPNMSHTNPARNKNILIILGKNWWWNGLEILCYDESVSN
jgi:hypothetical protein